MIYTTSQIAEIIQSEIKGKKSHEIKHILTDSRNLISAPDSLFFAINGEHHDGHNYIEDLYEKGVLNFVVEKFPLKKYPDAVFLLVENTLHALQKLAAYNRQQYKYPVIGITGSNGKTIVKEWLYYILNHKKQIIRSPKSFNSQIGVPLSVWLMNEKNNMAIFEAGISLPGEMEKLEEIIKPNIGLITNIGESHQENFESYKQKAEEKLKLFKNSETLVYSKDHELIHNIITTNQQYSQKKSITWSLKKEADIKITLLENNKSTTSIQYQYKNNKQEITIPFTDKASIEDAIHVITMLIALNLNPSDFKEKFTTMPVIGMRMELKKGINGCTIINDSYNSDLNSLSIALNYLGRQSQHKKKTLILSDILQSGKNNKELYYEVSKLVNKFKIDQIIGIGQFITEQKDLFDLEKYFYPTTEAFLEDLIKKDFSNEAILLKGSRNFFFEKISLALEEKLHRTVLEINLNALVHNLNYFRARLRPGVKIMAMVKALSYGSGTYEIANILQYQGVDYLGVAFADEGVLLREAGIKMPIIVMNPEQFSFNAMLEHKLEPEIYNLKVLHQFSMAVKNAGLKNYPVHLKLDTGMHRLGFLKNEIPKIIAFLQSNKSLKIKSVFSHLAASDGKGHDEFTRKQVKLFKELSKQIIGEIGYTVISHISNSAAIERFPDAQFDMVRLGIGLYGISAVNQEKLETVSTLKSTVIQIKQVSKNETIGYNRNFKVHEDMTIAIIPVGYADGLNRKLGNGRGKLYINGFYVPIIGNICMDMCMADITACNIHEGAEVIVFGKEQPVTRLAESLETIPYEIFTSVSSRVKRIYYQE